MQRFLSLEISAQDEAGQHEQSEQINSQNMEGRKIFRHFRLTFKRFFVVPQACFHEAHERTIMKSSRYSKY